MASTQRIGRKLGWLLACLAIAGLGCDDDNAADGDAHAAEHADTSGHDDEHGGAAGASEHEHDTTKTIGPETGGTCPDNGSTLTYDNFGKQFFADYCLGCHSTQVKGADRHDAPADHNFDTLDDITLLAPHIDQYAGSGPKATNTMMPPANAKVPSVDERKKLTEWLACGAKEN